MSILSKKITGLEPIRLAKPQSPNLGLWERYLTYADQQEDWKVYWYMKSIIVIPCVIMVPSIIAMASVIASFEWYVGITILLFFANIVVHIGEGKSRVYVPLYHLSILLMILIPFLTYILVA